MFQIKLKSANDDDGSTKNFQHIKMTKQTKNAK